MARIRASICVTPFGYSESRVIPVLQSELRSTTLDEIVLRSSSLQRGRGSLFDFSKCWLA